MSDALPRLVVAGAGGDSGKTLVSLGLIAAWKAAGRRVAAFKKGPDYIDAAWLGRAAYRPSEAGSSEFGSARSLDVWIMGEEGVRRSFRKGAEGADVCLVEGNRGLLDGYEGHSTASLARLLGAPVVLVLDVTKVTRTSAAIVAGIKALEPDLRLAAVIANRVGGSRHGSEVKTAIEEATGVPVLGQIPKIRGGAPLPDRHLGLVTPAEHGRADAALDRIAEVIHEHVDHETLFEIASSAGPDVLPPLDEKDGSRDAEELHPRVGFFRDAAFTFYYPENLEALERAGGRLVPVSALDAPRLPDLDALYIGGGFPETQAESLSKNTSLLRSVRNAALEGLPVYAECGGLIYLSRSVVFEGRRSPLAGVLDLDVEVFDRPQAHGYAEMVADRESPFFKPGTVIRGHEFHYSRIVSGVDAANLVFGVRRGTGTTAGRDGIVRDSVLATWLHLHASGSPDWAPAFVELARAHARGRERPGRDPEGIEPTVNHTGKLTGSTSR